MGVVNAAEFAKKLGVTKQRVVKGIESGLLKNSVTIKKKGKHNSYEIDLAAGLKEWADNIDPAKQRDPEKQNDTRALNDGGGPSHYQRAKAVKEHYGAQIARVQYEEMAGKLVPAAQVKAEAFKVARNVRDTLMGLPERVSAELAHMTEAREIAIYLRAQMADALKDLDGVQNVGTKRA